MYRYRGTGDTPLVDLSSLLNKFSNETIFGNHRNAVVVAVNNRARLHCEVINFGGGGIGKQSVNPRPHWKLLKITYYMFLKVTWIRTSDSSGDKIFQSISFGENKFINDRRISVMKENSNDWSLVIDPVKLTDSGDYECQVRDASF